MILQRLVEYYDRLAEDPANADSLPRSGYSRQRVSFCVVLDPDGTLQQFQSLLDPGNRKPIPRWLLVPGEAKPSGQGLNPCFLWDNAAYLLDFSRADADETRQQRDTESFRAFRERHLQLEHVIESDAYHAVCQFLRNWSRSDAEKHRGSLEEITSHFGVFRVAGDRRFVHEHAPVRDYWRRTQLAKDSVPTGMCLVTGRVAPIARLHEPKIKPVQGAQQAGALLVSFNDDAYTSFGKEQGGNAPVSLDAAFKYTNALNFLLQQDRRRVSLGDATVVFWAERPSPAEEVFSDLLGRIAPAAAAEDRQRVDQARLFVSQLRDAFGEADPFDAESDARFFVLGLSPNASRVSVRFWIDTTVRELRARLAQHMVDLELVGLSNERLLTVRRLIESTGRARVKNGRFEGYDETGASPLLAGSLVRAVLMGTRYPRALLTAMIERIRADGQVRHERVAAIKACLNRDFRLRQRSLEIPVALDQSRGEAAYVLGRLFALLEKIQTDSAANDLNTTIKDRYFSSASATPGVVFPRLIRLSQHHLAKLDVPLKIWYEKQVGEVVGRLNSFPAHFLLEDQGLFAIGYFHQRQALFAKKDHLSGATV